MKKPRLSKPPRSLRRSAVPLDNVALVPASLLPFKSVWQAIANHLPHGDMLIVLPYQAKQQNVARFCRGTAQGEGQARESDKQRAAEERAVAWPRSLTDRDD